MKFFSLIILIFKIIKTKSKNFIEISSLEKFQNQIKNIDNNFTESNLNYPKLLIIYLYSNSCPHCKIFSPKFESVANNFKTNKNLTFIRIENKIYQKIKKNFTNLKIEGFPAIFIFKLNEFFQFFDNFEEKNLMNFINENYEINCNFLKENEIKKFFFNKENKKKFILGIFSEKEKKFNIFKYLNNINSLFINKNNCYYFINNKNLTFLNNFNNKILIFNSKKGFNSFNLNEFNFTNQNFIINNQFKNYLKKFFFDDFYSIKKFQKKFLNLFKKSLYFFYENENEFFYFLNLIQTMKIEHQNLIDDFIIVFDNINNQINDSKIFYFADDSGIYYENSQKFEIIDINKIEKQKNNIQEFYNLNVLLNFLKEEKSGKFEKNESEKKLIEIRENLNKIQNELNNLNNFSDENEKKNENNKFLNNNNTIFQNTNENDFFIFKNIIIIFYLLIYSILFYFFYKFILINFTEENKAIKEF